MNDKPPTRVDSYLAQLKNHKVLSLIIVGGVVLLSLGAVSGALKNIIGLFSAKTEITSVDDAKASSSTTKPAPIPTVPLPIGESRQLAHRQFGNPNIANPEQTIGGSTFPASDTFFASGLILEYDEGNLVTAIITTLLSSGTIYSEPILGIAIGDEVAKCRSLWGNPVDWTETDFEYSESTWEFREYRISLEIWSENGEDLDFGAYESGTVKQIRVQAR